MAHALVISINQFTGRHLVEELLAHDYEVTILNDRQNNPLTDRENVNHLEGCRTVDADIERAGALEPDVVFDLEAYFPEQVRKATDVFEDADAYVYLSSSAVYSTEEVPKREGETPIHVCTGLQATDAALETYRHRKAEGERRVFEAAERGVNAMSVRSSLVYGPHNSEGVLDHWIDRVLTYDQVVLPGDGTNIWHRTYVEDLASAMRIVAERGRSGEPYNVGDRRILTLEELIELIADVAETDIEFVTASARELAIVGLSLEDVVLHREYPHVMATEKLAALGWESTPPREAVARTVEDYRTSDRDGSSYGPDRADEERLLDILDPV